MSRPIAPLRLLFAALACVTCWALSVPPAGAVAPPTPTTAGASSAATQVPSIEPAEQRPDPQQHQRPEIAENASFWVPVQFLLIALAGSLVVLRRNRE